MLFNPHTLGTFVVLPQSFPFATMPGREVFAIEPHGSILENISHNMRIGYPSSYGWPSYYAQAPRFGGGPGTYLKGCM